MEGTDTRAPSGTIKCFKESKVTFVMGMLH